MPKIFHITTTDQWALAKRAGAYEHPSLAEEGFIHLSTSAQAVDTTERYYADSKGLILLEVDTDRLSQGTLMWELAESVGQNFPHSYAPIPVSAVVAVHDWQGPRTRRQEILDGLPAEPKET